jgi:hypothetical protein
MFLIKFISKEILSTFMKTLGNFLRISFEPKITSLFILLFLKIITEYSIMKYDGFHFKFYYYIIIYVFYNWIIYFLFDKDKHNKKKKYVEDEEHES